MKLKDSQLEIRVVKKNSSSGKEMETGVAVTAYGCRRTVSVWPAQSEVINWRNPISGVL